MELRVDLEDATLSGSRHTPLHLLGRVLLTHEPGWVLTQTHEAAPVHLARDAVRSH